MSLLANAAAVAVGGAFGSLLRFAVVNGVGRSLGIGFPWGTLAVNVAGSFVIGMLAAWIGKGWEVTPSMRALLLPGLLGGFTTFSAFSLEAIELYEGGSPWAAGLYVLGSVVLSLAAVALALVLFRGEPT